MACEKEIKEELNKIINEYGLFNSKHEFYGVIAEELDEIYIDIGKLNEAQLNIWEQIKSDQDYQDEVKNIDTTLDNLIHEIIQVKAILQKLDKSTI